MKIKNRSGFLITLVALAVMPMTASGQQLRDVFRKDRSGSKDGDSIDARVENVLAAV